MVTDSPAAAIKRWTDGSDWTLVGAFKTEKTAPPPKLAKRSILEPDLDSYPYGVPPEEIYYVQCVASDDSRLAR